MAAHSAPHVSWYIILRSACILTYKSRCIGNAKGAAYSALLAFFPVLTTLAVLLVRFRAQAVSQVLSRTLEQIVPPGSESLVLSRFAVTGQRPVAVLVVAVIVAIYAASGIMLSLIEGFDDIYKLPNRSFLHQRGIAALLVVLSVLPVITASALILMGDRTERSVIASMGALKPGVLLLGRLIRIAIEIAATVGGAAILYRLAPNRPTSWREVWAGAFLVTALWYITTYGFRFYVANIARYNVMYGSVAAVIALGVWLYLLAFLALYGCAVNAVRAGATRVYSPELIDL